MNANQTNAQAAEAVKLAAMGNGKEVANEASPLILLPAAEPKSEKQEKKSVSEKSEKGKGEKKSMEGISALQPVKPKKMSIDELTEKAERVYMLQNKYGEIREKRKQLQNFVLKHEEDTAQLTLVDAKGMSIVTHNPTAIKNLLADWMKDLNNKLKEVEISLRTELELLS